MKCFYHKDQDGKGGASLVLKHNHKNNVDQISPKDFIALDYKNPAPVHLVSRNELVYIIDYSFKENTKYELDAILARTKNVVWLDHHASSVRLLEEHPEYYNMGFTIVIDTTKSGTMLAYNYFNPHETEIPLFIKYIDDHDRWVHRYKESIAFKLYMDSIDHGPFAYIWDELIYGEVDMNSIIRKGEIIHGYVNNLNLEDSKELAYESEIEGHKCIVVNRFMSGRNSDLLGDLLKKYPLGIVWTFDGSLYTYSLYSTNNIDCSIIAEKFGGGGHAKAAGFSCKELLFKGV